MATCRAARQDQSDGHQRNPIRPILSNAMCPDAPSQDAQPLLRGNASPQQRTCLLVETDLVRWPVHLVDRLTATQPVRIEELADSDFASYDLICLGYGHPAPGLASRLAAQDAAEVLAPLELWRLGCERMLELRQRLHQTCLLVNLFCLDRAAERELVGLVAAAGVLLPDSPKVTEPRGEPNVGIGVPAPIVTTSVPMVVQFYLEMRSDLCQLYQDLEGCADLLGRAPQFLASDAPRSRGLVLSEQLLSDWLEFRGQQARLRSDLHAELAAVREQAESSNDEIMKLRSELMALRSRQETFDQLIERAGTAETRLQEAVDNQQLTQLQLRQLQDELAELFDLYQRVCRQRHELGEQHSALEARFQEALESQELARRQKEQLQDELSKLFDAHQQIRRQYDALKERHGELEVRCQDVQEAQQLAVIQKMHLQDELAQLFDDHRQASLDRQQLGAQLAALEQECHYLFLNSRLDGGIDRTRIAGVLRLMRESLQP